MKKDLIIPILQKYNNFIELDDSDMSNIHEDIAQEILASIESESISDSSLSFEQCLNEEFLVNTQNYPEEYHQLFQKKFRRAEKRFKEQVIK